jgi:rod shape-determining protein MreB
VSRDVAIDLGTTTTLVHGLEPGSLLIERSVLAIDRDTGAVVAAGADAWRMIGRAPERVEALRPLSAGSISNFDATATLLESVLGRGRSARRSRLHALVAVPGTMGAVERRAVVEATLAAGARSCRLVAQPPAAALGAGLPVWGPVGSLVVDAGGGSCEISLVAMGGMVVNKALRMGGSDLDASIQDHLRHEHALVIGERTAEAVKEAVGSASPSPELERKAEVAGRDLASGVETSVIVTSGEIREAITAQLRELVSATLECIGDSPPDLVEDVMRRGITLSGGGSLLAGMAVLLADEIGVPVQLSSHPVEAVVRGAARALESGRALESMLLDPDQ